MQDDKPAPMYGVLFKMLYIDVKIKVGCSHVILTEVKLAVKIHV